MNAPPRRPTAPASFTAWAISSSLPLVLDAARPGDHADLRPADVGAAGLSPQRDDRPLLLHLARRHLVRREDRHDLVDAVDGLQDAAVLEPVVADDGDDGPLGPDDDVIFKSHFAHQFDDVLDLLLGRAGFMTTIIARLLCGVQNEKAPGPRPEALGVLSGKIRPAQDAQFRGG